MSGDDLPRTSIDKLNDAFTGLCSATITALEEAVVGIWNFLKGMT